MDQAHDTALTDLMRDLCDVGVVSIELRVLLRWFERANLTKGIWRDLQQRFDRVLLERKKHRLGLQLLSSVSGSMVALICFDPPSVAAAERNWFPVSERAEPALSPET